MPLVNRLLRRAYAGIRVAGVVDVKRLLWLAADSLQPVGVSDGYHFRPIDRSEAAQRVEAGNWTAAMGDPRRLDDSRNRLWAAFRGSELAAFVWFAAGWIEASENFSRARHLGTRIDLPPRVAFAYNAWTSPAHRGQRLMPALLTRAVAPGEGGEAGLVTTTDWTNDPALAAFSRAGFVQLGLIYRVGRGRCQWTVAPRAAADHGIGIVRAR